MTNYLGIDYGLSHLGLATSEHRLATPLKSLSNDIKLIEELKKIISENHITHIVCGIPEGKLAPMVQKFSDQLSRATGIQVELHPETLSTQEATSKLREVGASKAKRRNDHAYAACLILEDYLELKSAVY